MAGGKTFKRDQKRRKEMARRLKQEEKNRKRAARKEEGSKKSLDELELDAEVDAEEGRFGALSVEQETEAENS
jgi:hypothetical protein